MNAGWVIAAVGWGAALATVVLAKLSAHLRARHRRFGLVLVLAALATGSVAAGALWYRYRPWPPALDLQVAEGIGVRRYGTETPRPLLVSVAEIDLRIAGREILTTELSASGTALARTTRQFALQRGAAVAVNAHFFTPFWSKSPWSFYPEGGDPVSPLGLNAADGVVVDHGGWNGATVWFHPGGGASVGDPPGAPWDAITGRYRLLDGGRVVAPTGDELAPRVALGLSDGGHRLLFVVVDGRQPGFAEGVTLRELAEIVRAHGAEDAVELDGGGSATMVAAKPGAAPILVNTPIHTRVPGRERPVATHIGVRVASPDAPERRL